MVNLNKKDAKKKIEMLQAMYLDIFVFAEILFGDKDNAMHYHVRSKSQNFNRYG